MRLRAFWPRAPRESTSMNTKWTFAATAILLTLLCPTPSRQSAAQTVSAEGNAIDSLPPCSILRDAREHMEGKPAEPYMEAMRSQSIRRAFLELHSTRSHSGPTDIRVVLHLYFSQFDGPGSLVTDETTLKKIRDSGLEATLDDLAKARVLHAPFLQGMDYGGRIIRWTVMSNSLPLQSLSLNARFFLQ